MIKIFLISFIFILPELLFAQKYVDIKLKTSKANFSIDQQSQQGFTFSTSFENIRATEINSGGNNYVQLSIDGFSRTYNIGQPDLPVLTKLIEVPQNAVAKVKVISYDEQIIDLKQQGIDKLILPAQPSQSKAFDLNDGKFRYDSTTYSNNGFFAKNMVIITDIGTMRAVRLAHLQISPLAYNPVTGQLKIYNNIVVQVTFSNADLKKTNQLKANLQSPYFNPSAIPTINQTTSTQSSSKINAPAKYVIVSDPMFKTALAPFITWKTKQGFNVIAAYTDNPGVGKTTTSIKAYLQALYNAATPTNPAPSFVLFVGDVSLIPTWPTRDVNGAHPTDLYYCDYTNDNIPDVFYGRFSANNLTQLQPQIDKTLEYEQYTMPDPTYLNRAVLVAGAASGYTTYSNGQMNYAALYFNSAHGFSPNIYLQPETGTTVSQIKSSLNAGAGFANYSAHCSASGWSDPSISTADIPNLTNAHKYGLWIGNCCLSNKFDTECLGVDALRTANKGAIGYIGGSDNTYWDEDYYWSVGYKNVVMNPTYSASNLGAYDRAFHDHGESSNQWFITQGQMVTAGDLAVQQSTSDLKLYYWEVYHLMGDPSLCPYYAQPKPLSAYYQQVIFLGTTSLDITTEPYSYIGLSMNGKLITGGTADSTGLAQLSFVSLANVGNIDIVISHQNRQPLISQIQVVPAKGPYVFLQKNYAVNDSIGNNNGVADYNEQIALNISLKNVGISQAKKVICVLSSTDKYISIVDSTYSFGNIDTAVQANLKGIFKINIAPVVPNNHVVVCTISVISTDTTWKYNLQFSIKAPILNASFYKIDDHKKPYFKSLPIDTAIENTTYRYLIAVAETPSNNNGFLESGEFARINALVKNTGGSDIKNVMCQIKTTNPHVNVINNTFKIPLLRQDSSVVVNFPVQMDTLIKIGSMIDFSFSAVSGGYGDTTTYFTKAGVIMENFETGNFSKFKWDTSAVRWIADTTDKWEGRYSARSGRIGDSDTSWLSITLNILVNDSISFYRKVSSEDGWDFLKFYIDGQEKGAWSGLSTWSQFKYPVTAGKHTFRWSYEKDESQFSYADCAWIDYIIFPTFQTSGKKSGLVLTSNAPPSWLSFKDYLNGTALLLGTPLIENIGLNPVTIYATNGIETQSQIFQIDVLQAPNAPPLFTSQPDTSVNVNSTYFYNIVSTDLNPNDNLSYGTKSIPSWLHLVDNGNRTASLTGTPKLPTKGLYPVVIYVTDGIDTVYQTFYIDVKDLSGVAQTESSQKISIYPNPAKNIVYVDNCENAKVYLYNVLGDLVLETNSSSSFCRFDVNQLTAGTYFVKIIKSNTIVTQKLNIVK